MDGDGGLNGRKNDRTDFGLKLVGRDLKIDHPDSSTKTRTGPPVHENVHDMQTTSTPLHLRPLLSPLSGYGNVCEMFGTSNKTTPPNPDPCLSSLLRGRQRERYFRVDMSVRESVLGYGGMSNGILDMSNASVGHTFRSAMYLGLATPPFDDSHCDLPPAQR